MPIGYSHGKQYVVDKRYDRYAEMPVFREIVKVGMKAGYGAHIYFSHITRNYCCEVRKLNQRFQGSGNVYWVTAGHKYADTPLEALTLAFRECVPHTPYLAALYLEANWSLLVEAIRQHQRLDRALDDLNDIIARIAESAAFRECFLDLHMRDVARIFPGAKISATRKPDLDDDL